MSRSSAGPVLAVVAVVMLLLMVLYLGALGPLVWLTDRGIIEVDENSPIGWIYMPLGILADNCEPFDTAISWYMSWWESPPTIPADLTAGPASPYADPAPAFGGVPIAPGAAAQAP